MKRNCFFLLIAVLISLNSIAEQRDFEEDKNKDLEQEFLKNSGKSMTYEEFIKLIEEYGNQAAEIFSSMHIIIEFERSDDEYDEDAWRTIIRIVTDNLGHVTDDTAQVDTRTMVKAVANAVEQGIAQVDDEAGIYGQCGITFLGRFMGKGYYAYITYSPQNDADTEKTTEGDSQSA